MTKDEIRSALTRANALAARLEAVLSEVRDQTDDDEDWECLNQALNDQADHAWGISDWLNYQLKEWEWV